MGGTHWHKKNNKYADGATYRHNENAEERLQQTYDGNEIVVRVYLACLCLM